MFSVTWEGTDYRRPEKSFPIFSNIEAWTWNPEDNWGYK